MAETTQLFKVEGMHCKGCANNVRLILEEDVAGVVSAEVNLDAHEVKVSFVEGVFNFDEAAAEIQEGGYTLVKP